MKSFALYYKANRQEIKNTNKNFFYKFFLIYPFGKKKSDAVKINIGDPSICEMHVNVWKVYKGTIRIKPRYFFDFGIKLSFKCEELLLYIPFKIKICDNYDISQVIVNQSDLLCSIFNDEMISSPCENSCYHTIKSKNNDEEFYFYQLGSQNFKGSDYTKKKGTYLRIKINGNPNNIDNNSIFLDKQLYIRFRVEVSENSEVVVSEHISNDLIQAAFSMTDLFDLRFNERREINNKIQEYMTCDDMKLFSFNKIHIFYITDTREDVVNASSIKVDSRLLENDHWTNYIPSSDLKNQSFVAHHWKKKMKNDQPIKDFTVFFNTKYPYMNVIRLLSYFGVVVLFSFIGSMLTFPINDFFSAFESIKLLKPLIVIVILVLLIFYILYNNFSVKWIRINRKR